MAFPPPANQRGPSGRAEAIALLRACQPEPQVQDLLRDRERVLTSVELDQWARAEAVPSEVEIQRIRELIERVEADLDDLTEEEREQINAAVKVVRATRTTVNLGMPRIAPPRPELNGETG